MKEFTTYRQTKSIIHEHLDQIYWNRITFVSPLKWLFSLATIKLKLSIISSKLLAYRIIGNDKMSFAMQKLVRGTIYLDDLLIDTYLRYKPSPWVNWQDIFMTEIAVLANTYINFYQSIFGGSKNFGSVALSYGAYIHHGIAMRLAYKESMKVVSYGCRSCFAKLHDSSKAINNPSHTPDFDTLTPSAARRVTSKIKSKAQYSLELRRSGNYDETMIYMNTNAKFLDYAEKLHIKDSRILMLHDFFDSPHCYGDILFEDFWEWAKTTISTCVENNLQLLVKPHPNQIPGNERIIKLLASMYKDSNLIKWLSPQVKSAFLLNKSPSLIITAYGSVASEAAYCGIPVLFAGDHPGINFNLGKRPDSIEEYIECLINPNAISVPSKESVVDFTSLLYRDIYNESWASLSSAVGVDFEEFERLQGSTLNTKKIQIHLKSNSQKILTYINS